jgi:amino acid permease
MNETTRFFQKGSYFNTTVNFITGTMGFGNITLAYVLMKNGYFLGYLLIMLGGLLSYYTGMLIVKCAHLTGKNRYEDIALSIYGPKIAKLTSLLMLACLIGFCFPLIVYIKNAVP